MSSANGHQIRLHLWSGMALMVVVLVASLAFVEGKSAGAKISEPDEEVQDDTSDYLEDGDLNAALTGAAAPSHHHHIHVHPKSSARTSRRPLTGKAECDCSKNKTALGASRTSPVDPLEDFTTTTTTEAPEADDAGASKADMPEEEDLTDDYLEETEPQSGPSTPAPPGNSRAADDLDDADNPGATSAKPSIMSVPDEANTTVTSTTEAPTTAKPAITIKPIQLDQPASNDEDGGDS